MEIQFSSQARKQFRQLAHAERDRIIARAEDCAAQPRARHHDVVPLIGRPETYRLRVGDWRIIFEIAGETMLITRVAHRREVYR